MPIDARIPLGVTPVDPNGFTNALAAGMKMRELQQAGDRLAYKDEAAVRKSNALAEFGQSDRGPEAVKRLYRDAPDAAPAAEKNIRDAGLAGEQTKKLQAEWAKANHALLAEASGAILANPTRENATMVLNGLVAQGGDMSLPLKQLESTPDQAIPGLAKGWVGNAAKVSEMARADEKAGRPPVSNTTTDGLVTYDPNNPLGGVIPLPGQTSRALKPPPAPKTITKAGVTYEHTDAGWVPAPGVPATPSEPTRAVSQADAAWLKDQDKSGAAAEKLSGTIEQVRGVIGSEAGVLGSAPLDRAAYGLHQLGVNNSDAAVNTERLRELGAQMTLSFGSLGAQVSNADREVYAKAQGNFENAKSPEAMKLSLDQMAGVAQRTIEKVNRNRTTYQQTGRKPDFAGAPPAQAGPAGPPAEAGSAPAPQSAGEYARLPSGTRFTAPDGSVRTKP